MFATGAVEGVTRQAPLQYNLSQVVSVEQGISHTERRLFSWLNVVSHGNGIISFIPFLLPPDYNVFIVTYVQSRSIVLSDLRIKRPRQIK